jgi:hypothetical protein
MLAKVRRTPGTGDYDHIKFSGNTGDDPRKLLAQHALDSIARHCVPDLARHRQAKPSGRCVIAVLTGEGIHHEMAAGRRPTASIYGVEVTRTTDASSTTSYRSLG